MVGLAPWLHGLCNMVCVTWSHGWHHGSMVCVNGCSNGPRDELTQLYSKCVVISSEDKILYKIQ